MVLATDAPGQLQENESSSPNCWRPWVRGFVDAAAWHGLPALRRDVATKGLTI